MKKPPEGGFDLLGAPAWNLMTHTSSEVFNTSYELSNKSVARFFPKRFCRNKWCTR